MMRSFNKRRESIDIGMWQNYAPYTNKDQLHLQRTNLVAVGVDVLADSHANFIYTKYVGELNYAVESMFVDVPVEDTVTTLETEVYFTTKIEGSKTTRKRTSEIHNGAPIKNCDFSEKMVKNCFDAIKFMNLYGNQMNPAILISTWKILTNDACDNKELGCDGYRKSDDIIIGGHVPPPWKDIPELMRKWFTFYDSEELEDIPLVKACILHYAFEVLHPFCDGNGRMGRLLMNNYLISRGFEAARAVSFSMQIDRTRAKYDAAFVASENLYNDCTPMIEYLLSDVMYVALSEITDCKIL